MVFWLAWCASGDCLQLSTSLGQRNIHQAYLHPQLFVWFFPYSVGFRMTRSKYLDFLLRQSRILGQTPNSKGPLPKALGYGCQTLASYNLLIIAPFWLGLLQLKSICLWVTTELEFRCFNFWTKFTRSQSLFLKVFAMDVTKLSKKNLKKLSTTNLVQVFSLLS